MNYSLIFTYSLRALSFAFCIGGIFLIWQIFRHKQENLAINRKEVAIQTIFTSYVAALFQITIVRNWDSFFSHIAGFQNLEHSLTSLQLIPFATTLGALNLGIGSFIYHLIGNMIWFLPFGFLAPKIWQSKLKNTLINAAILSTSIELSQFIFQTGVSDIDDIIVNTLGALAGFMLHKKIHL